MWPTDALHDDIDALHRNAAARRGIAVDDEQAAAAGRARRLRGVALHPDFAGHHVFGNALPGIALDHHRGVLVHAGAVIADMAFDLDQNRLLETDGDRMLPARIENAPMRFVAVGS